MAMIEKQIKLKTEFLIKLWLRFVDDVFAIIKKTHLRRFLKFINSIHPAINFTMEMENNSKLPFLDVLVIPTNDHLEFDVYRKACTTSRYICINSQHSPQHKLSAFQSMIHRLLTFPLTKDRYNTEMSHIRDVAAINGFNPSVITSMVIKKRKALKREQMTSPRSKSGT